MLDPFQNRTPSRKIDLHEFMEKNFRCDMSMTEFAKASGRSLSTFKRDFKKMSELSPERWLTDRRLRAAYELLKRGRRVSDACFDVGFKNVSHFSAIFKKKFGITPGQARKGSPHNPMCGLRFVYLSWIQAFASSGVCVSTPKNWCLGRG